MSTAQSATQYSLGSLEIDGNDVIGLFKNISLYENIFSPILAGEIVLIDTDDNDFIGQYQIEGNEEITFDFTDAIGQQLQFSGVLNGLKNKMNKGQEIVYAFDFNSIEVWKNEESFVTKRFKNIGAKDVATEMIQRLGGQIDKITGESEPMDFLGSRKRPTDIIKYVLTHGISKAGGANATENKKEQEEEASGSTGFLCWQTMSGYRFVSVDEMLKGDGGNEQEEIVYRLQNRSLSGKDAHQAIVQYDFQEMGDMQTKMRSGAFSSRVISFDMDKGLYKEYTHMNEKNMTEKQKKAVTKPTRFISKLYVNERFQQEEDKADRDKYDQSRKSLAQNAGRQNTFADQFGSFTLPAHFEYRAGDRISVKIAKVAGEKEGGYNDKHSGYYIIKQVGHHLFSDGTAYTKISTIRSTVQQDDATSSQ